MCNFTSFNRYPYFQVTRRGQRANQKVFHIILERRWLEVQTAQRAQSPDIHRRHNYFTGEHVYLPSYLPIPNTQRVDLHFSKRFASSGLDPETPRPRQLVTQEFFIFPGKRRNAIFRTQSSWSGCHWFCCRSHWHGQISIQGETPSCVRHRSRHYQVSFSKWIGITYQVPTNSFCNANPKIDSSVLI